jgi:hypothetical protein
MAAENDAPEIPEWIYPDTARRATHAMRLLINPKVDDLDLLREAIKALADHADLVSAQNNEED